MSTSTNAVLFYGLCWTEEAELIQDGEEWKYALLRKRGFPDPWDKYPYDEGRPGYEQFRLLPYEEKDRLEKAWVAAHREELDTRYAAARAVTEEFTCDIDHHCSGDYGMPYVFVKATETTARRGYPVNLTARKLAPDPLADAQLAAFCAALGIDTKDAQGPGWFLVSYWG